MTHARPTLLATVVAGSAWFWGARLLAGALVSWGLSFTVADAVTWGGAIATGWVLASQIEGDWRDAWRMLPAATLIALPEAITSLAGRYATATSLGLRVDVLDAVVGTLGRLAAVVVLLAALGLVAAWLRRQRLTSAVPRSPT